MNSNQVSSQKQKLSPKLSLNKAYQKLKPNRVDIERFKKYLRLLMSSISESESEEFHKNLVSDFLKNTYYSPSFFINTKGRNDLVIHNSSTAKSTVGVILEAKKASNSEMCSTSKLNTKALHELVLYYLRERITEGNLEVKHLLITNVEEWFIFDAANFDRLFAQNKNLVKLFNDFIDRRLADTKTEFFYKQIAEPFIQKIEHEIQYTHFKLSDYQVALTNEDVKDDKKLIALFKLLSPEHLLKLPFANDSNSLDKSFYSELLHLIGLEEKKEGSKKVIRRLAEKDRNPASLLENTILQIQSEDLLYEVKNRSQYGEDQSEQIYSIALELCITWVNRILFLKLVESQVIQYHSGDTDYAFLNSKQISGYDALNSLFFKVLAKDYDERIGKYQKGFEHVPYLNSSLFEPTDLENQTLKISNLEDDYSLPILSSTVLKEQNGKKKTGSLNTLDYFFAFLNAYDFSSEGAEDIQEDNKTLINASVLGLIFEKINGYKDGSFFTPGFITMYMCKETIRKAVIQKFNEEKGWNCKEFDDVYDKIEDRTEANAIVNSLKICDPAVGSGHFLVSALNEMIAIKNDLNILQDKKGRRLKEYTIEVVNDELIITDDDGELFEYKPGNSESQRVQETLFHEKQTIIENCLFGVDINPNSVKICRLRLWIELLKNAYYQNSRSSNDSTRSSSDSRRELYREVLVTLPNIDINIKCGNSLVSRFALDADIKQALKSSKWTIDGYKIAVDTYRNAKDKEEKRAMEKLISDIKGDFRSEISASDPKLKKLSKAKGKLFNLSQEDVFGLSKKEESTRKKQVEKLAKEIDKLETEIEEIKSNKIYENAFEWRFEFPEVLNDEGEFVGFDVVIGNPPYISIQELKKNSPEEVKFYSKYYSTASKGNFDIYLPFTQKSFSISNNYGIIDFIMPSLWIYNEYGAILRSLVQENKYLNRFLDFGSTQVFEDATVYTACQQFDKIENNEFSFSRIDVENFKNKIFSKIPYDYLSKTSSWNLTDDLSLKIIHKMNKGSIKLGDCCQIFVGIQTSADSFYHLTKLPSNNWYSKIENQNINIEETYLRPLVTGKDVNRYVSPIIKKYLLHLYDEKNLSLFKINHIELETPNTFYYLKRNENFLRAREKGKMDNDGWFGYNYPKNLEKQTLPKIGVGQTVQKLECFLDEKGDFYFHNVRVNGITPMSSDLDIKYLLGCLNSKALSFYFTNTAKPKDNGYYEANKQFIEPLPIKVIELENQLQIAEIVNQILLHKKQDQNIDTTKLENQIDQLVYELYGLTEEEIKIVEEGVK